MSKFLKPNILLLFKNKFETNCFKLLNHAYYSVLDEKLSELDENDITLELVKKMRENPISSQYKIDITREYYLDDMIKVDQKADESSRIDIRFMNWSSKEKIQYFMEAKNLSESDWKKSTGAKVYFSKQATRYIKTGIDSFIQGKYSNGCLLGYIVNGTTEGVVTKLNFKLSGLFRSDEQLTRDNQNELLYFSQHNTNALRLMHVLIKLS